MTLYPFTKRSLMAMFQGLKEKSPRHYLDYAIKQMFRQFAMDMVDKNWSFPTIPSYITPPSMNITYASSVEDSNLSSRDKDRLKTLLSTWGNGTSVSSNGCTGSIPNEFLKEIGLGGFSGLSQTQGGQPESGAGEAPQDGVQPDQTEVRPVQAPVQGRSGI